MVNKTYLINIKTEQSNEGKLQWKHKIYTYKFPNGFIVEVETQNLLYKLKEGEGKYNSYRFNKRGSWECDSLFGDAVHGFDYDPKKNKFSVYYSANPNSIYASLSNFIKYCSLTQVPMESIPTIEFIATNLDINKEDWEGIHSEVLSEYSEEDQKMYNEVEE